MSGNVGSGLSSATDLGQVPFDLWISVPSSGKSFLSFFFLVSTKLFLGIYHVLIPDDRHWGTQGPLRLSFPSGGFRTMGSLQWGKTHSIAKPVGAQRREWPILFGGVFQKKRYKLSCKEGLVRWGVFPGSSESKESACSAGDLSFIFELGRSPGEGNGYPLQ